MYERKLATKIMKYDDYLAYFERGKSSDLIILCMLFAYAYTFIWCPIATQRKNKSWTKESEL